MWLSFSLFSSSIFILINLIITSINYTILSLINFENCYFSFYKVFFDCALLNKSTIDSLANFYSGLLFSSRSTKLSHLNDTLSICLPNFLYSKNYTIFLSSYSYRIWFILEFIVLFWVFFKIVDIFWRKGTISSWKYFLSLFSRYSAYSSYSAKYGRYKASFKNSSLTFLGLSTKIR